MIFNAVLLFRDISVYAFQSNMRTMSKKRPLSYNLTVSLAGYRYKSLPVASYWRHLVLAAGVFSTEKRTGKFVLPSSPAACATRPEPPCPMPLRYGCPDGGRHPSGASSDAGANCCVQRRDGGQPGLHWVQQITSDGRHRAKQPKRSGLRGGSARVVRAAVPKIRKDPPPFLRRKDRGIPKS